jgi:Protein of unknown function (DUF3341)
LYLEAEFRETESVVGAIRSLRGAGIQPGDIELFSAEPVELPRGVLDRPSRMSLVSVAGALGFGSLATLFMYWAQHNYTVLTGGMPVFSFWATGVISFEMTMLGAIVSAFLWFIWESGLLRRREGPPPPLVEPGSIRLRVRYDQSEAPRVTDALRRSGAKW